MAVALQEIIITDLDEPRIEIAGINTSNNLLAEREVTFDTAYGAMAVQVSAVNHVIEDADFKRFGDRTLFGVFVENKALNRRLEIETIAGPVRFKTDRHFEPQFLCEDSILARIKFRCGVFGRAALQLAGLIAPLPGAKQSETELYETAAPGVKLYDAVNYIRDAHDAGRLSNNEAAVLLSTMHDSARAALGTLHDLNLVHGHAHLNNFNVDITSGTVRLFDYTLAMECDENTAFARPGWGGMNDASPTEDINRFESKWQDNVRQSGLSDQCPSLSEDEKQAAIAKLERTIIFGALYVVTGAHPSDQDINRYIETRRDLISEAPTITYPRLKSVA